VFVCVSVCADASVGRVCFADHLRSLYTSLFSPLDVLISHSPDPLGSSCAFVQTINETEQQTESLKVDCQLSYGLTASSVLNEGNDGLIVRVEV